MITRVEEETWEHVADVGEMGSALTRRRKISMVQTISTFWSHVWKQDLKRNLEIESVDWVKLAEDLHIKLTFRF
jgi:hypothetical protein